MNFFENKIFNNLKGFQELNTEEKKRYIALNGHFHFSQWLVNQLVEPHFFRIVSAIDIFICVMNMIVILMVEETSIVFAFFLPSFPFIVFFTFLVKTTSDVWKMDQETFEKWYIKAVDKVQTWLFADYIVFNIWKRMHVRKIDKEFYKHLQTSECKGECYRATFKLAYLLNDPKVKIVWIAGTTFDGGDRYGHAVLEKNGYILDTNTRRSYRKKKYLKIVKAEIFYEYSREEYMQCKDPWELKWEEFGKWCKENNVQRAI